MPIYSLQLGELLWKLERFEKSRVKLISPNFFEMEEKIISITLCKTGIPLDVYRGNIHR